MKKFLFTLLFCTLPLVASAQMGGAFGTGGTGSLDLSTLLPIIDDSSRWTDGSHIHAIKPKDGKSIEADSGKFGALHVTGNTTLDGNLTMVTTATEQVKLGTGSDAAPELSSAGDTDTGIRFAGGDKMQLVQGGLNSHTFRPYRYTMTYSDGDTLGIFGDGASFYYRTNATTHSFYTSTTLAASFGSVSNGFITSVPNVTDTYTLGSAIRFWKGGYFSDGLWLGSKSQTARLLISGENTIAGTDSSWDINATNGVPTATAYHTGTFSNGGRRHYFGPDTTLINYAKTGRDSTVYVLQDGTVRFTGPLQSIGGNARGANAVDLQTSRAAATQVASGVGSFVMGLNCTANASAAIAFGNATLAGGSSSVSGGYNTTTSAFAAVALGSQVVASGENSLASGNLSLANLYSSKAHASGRFAATGDAQLFEVVLRDTTQSSQSDTLKLDGSEALTTGYFTISANQAMYFKGMLVAWVVTGADDNKGACYELEGMITRDGSNNTTLVWQSVTEKYEHADLAGLTVTMSADDTNERLNIICAGKTANTIRWVCTVRASQVGG